MDKFTQLLDLLEKLDINDEQRIILQRKAVECRTEFNIENASKKEAQARQTVYAEILENIFKQLMASRSCC